MRSMVLLAGLALLLNPALVAQEGEEPQETQVYHAFHKISYADLEEWISDYHEHTVPIMRELQAEGIITGWGAWQHSTGSDYNWRFAIRAAGWAQLGEFWQHYLERLQERAPEAFARAGEMIEAHYDEVWNIDEVHVPADAESQYMYDSRFQIGFGELEAWNEMWTTVVAPVLNQAMDDGLLAGWVRLGHNTGARYNWKVLYLFAEWDTMDDLFGRAGAALAGDPDAFRRFGRMVAAHDDVIWAAVPDPDEM